MIWIIVDFSSEAVDANRQWNNIFKVMKENVYRCNTYNSNTKVGGGRVKGFISMV